MQLNDPVRQKDGGNKEQRKAERQRRKWIGDRKLELCPGGFKEETNLFRSTPVHHRQVCRPMGVCGREAV